jgi:hypothetical protein
MENRQQIAAEQPLHAKAAKIYVPLVQASITVQITPALPLSASSAGQNADQG